MSASDHPDLPSFFNACEGGHDATARLLLYNEKNPVPVDAVDTYGNTALHQAAKTGRLGIIRMLLGRGASTAISNNYRETALHKAAEGGYTECVKSLLSEGHADPYALDVFSSLPIQLAAKKGHKEVVKAFILVANMDPEIKDKQGNSLLDMANDGRHLDLQVYLKAAVKKFSKKKAEGAVASAAADGGVQNNINNSTSSPLTPPTNVVVGVNTNNTDNHHANATTEITSMTSHVNSTDTVVSNTIVLEEQKSSGSKLEDHKSQPETNNNNKLQSVGSNNNNNNNPSQIPVSTSSGGLLHQVTPSNNSVSTSSTTNLGFSQVFQAGAISSSTEAATNKAVEQLIARVRTLFPPYYIFDFKDIEIQKRLGAGGGGSVFRAVIKSCHRPIAAKLFREADGDGETAIHECQMAMNVHHKNIIQLIGVTVVGNLWPLPSAELMMLMELGDGTLQGLLNDFKKQYNSSTIATTGNRSNNNLGSNNSNNNNNATNAHSLSPSVSLNNTVSSPTSPTHHFTWERIIRYAYQMASGLEYLHENKIMHLDLKPANCLIDSNQIIKLCDFGLTRGMQSEATHLDISRVNLGTRRWMSPEQSVSSRVAPTNDTYSWGAILFNMINEDALEPWAGMDANEIAKSISSCLAAVDRRNERIRNEDEKQVPESVLVEDDGLMSQLVPRDGCPPFLVDLCKRCLVVDYSRRPKTGRELVELLKKGVSDLLAMNPEGAGAIVGDVTYMELMSKKTESGGGLLQEQVSASNYGEQTEVIEGGGYD